MKLVTIILAVMWLSLSTYATAVLADDRDQKIEMLETLLERYIEENRELKALVEALEERTPSQSVAAGATTCANDPSKCEDTVLCTFAVTLTEGNYIWSTQPQWINYVQEAQKRGLNCKVSETASQQESTAVLTCETDPQVCGDEELCSLATDEYKAWKSGVSQKFVDEARERNLECGIVKVTEAPTQNMPGCTEDHEILAKFARELFSKQSTGKEFWTSCSKGGTIISLGFSDGQTIAYNQSSSFRGFVFGPDSAVFFGGAVVCFDADLGVKKRGKGFYCSEQ
jgi:hypothetical protein